MAIDEELKKGSNILLEAPKVLVSPVLRNLSVCDQ